MLCIDILLLTEILGPCIWYLYIWKTVTGNIGSQCCANTFNDGSSSSNNNKTWIQCWCWYVLFGLSLFACISAAVSRLSRCSSRTRIHTPYYDHIPMLWLWLCKVKVYVYYTWSAKIKMKFNFIQMELSRAMYDHINAYMLANVMHVICFWYWWYVLIPT